MLSTREFAQALGVSESSVRRMADAGELQIHRTRGGHRRIPVAEAVRYVRETRARVSRPDLLGLSADPGMIPRKSFDDRMHRALLEGHAAQVISLVQGMYASGVSIAEICDGPIQAAMQRIGDQWPHDRRAIFVEHRATTLCIRALHQLRSAMPDPDEAAPEAIGAAPAGDSFSLPAVMVAIALHECGLNETCLGPNTPIDVVTDAVEDERPALAWLSISVPLASRTAERQLLQLAEVAQASGTELIIGGRHAKDVQVPPGTGIRVLQDVSEMTEFATDLMKARADAKA